MDQAPLTQSIFLPLADKMWNASTPAITLACSPCWEQFYGKGSVPAKPTAGNTLTGYLPPGLATAVAAGAGGTAVTGDGGGGGTAGVPYTVNATKGGGIPVSIQKRAKGKKVTARCSRFYGQKYILYSLRCEHLRREYGV
jgi:hypothetical protein